MSFRQYETYKDSTVQWLGSVPEHWMITPLCGAVKERNESNRGMIEDNLLSLSYGRIIKKDILSNDGLLPESFETYQIVYPGDIVFRLTDLQNDKRSLRSAIVDQRGIITSAYLAVSTSNDHPKYMSYLFRGYDSLKVFYSMGGGLRQSMKFADMKRLPVLRPPLPEQVSIATFLDNETSQIDVLVDEQKHLIELLKEKRQAVISQAVTRGLNANVSMKDSGVEWLGDVPAHWTIQRGRFLFDQASDLPEDGDGVVTAFRDGQVTLRENRRTDGFTFAVLEVGYQHVRKGDLVIHGMDAFAGAIGISESDGKCSPEYSVLRPKVPGLLNSYFAAILRLMALRNFIYVICPSVRERAPRFRYESFKDVWLPVPPPDEQNEIMRHIDIESRRLTELANEAERLIALSVERRSAIVCAAVTGKIDVRSWRKQEELEPA